MPPKTRKTKKEDVEEEAVEEILEETKPAKLPESDESYSRKVVISKGDFLYLISKMNVFVFRGQFAK